MCSTFIFSLHTLAGFQFLLSFSFVLSRYVLVLSLILGLKDYTLFTLLFNIPTGFRFLLSFSFLCSLVAF